MDKKSGNPDNYTLRVPRVQTYWPFVVSMSYKYLPGEMSTETSGHVYKYLLLLSLPPGWSVPWCATWSTSWACGLTWAAGSTSRQKGPMSSSPTIRAPWTCWVCPSANADTMHRCVQCTEMYSTIVHSWDNGQSNEGVCCYIALFITNIHIWRFLSLTNILTFLFLDVTVEHAHLLWNDTACEGHNKCVSLYFQQFIRAVYFTRYVLLLYVMVRFWHLVWNLLDAPCF